MMAFLCGGMEYAADGGREWRERIRSWLQEKLNHRVYDPCVESRRIFTREEQECLPTWKLTDLDRYHKAMHIIINHDLNVMASQADYVICFWDEDAARGGGTQAELTAAYRKGIPVYFVTALPVEKVSGWVVGCTSRIFSTFDELKSFLTATYGSEVRQRALWGTT